jgi:hypothetical protein
MKIQLLQIQYQTFQLILMIVMEFILERLLYRILFGARPNVVIGEKLVTFSGVEFSIEEPTSLITIL